MADTIVQLPSTDGRLPIVLRVETTDGGWTPAPYVSVEAGSELELTEGELRWLVDVGGPEALVALGRITEQEEHHG